VDYNSLSIQLDITDPNVKYKLTVLPEKMSDAAFEVVMKEAELIKGLAQIYVPVDTGSLRDSIRVERGGTGLRWREVRIRAGGYVTNPETGRFVDYAKFQEYGTKYMVGQFFIQRAFDEVTGTLREKIQEGVNRKVSEELGNLTYTEPGIGTQSYISRREGWF
jgi:HK97 gp10 family phage protein